MRQPPEPRRLNAFFAAFQARYRSRSPVQSISRPGNRDRPMLKSSSSPVDGEGMWRTMHSASLTSPGQEPISGSRDSIGRIAAVSGKADRIRSAQGSEKSAISATEPGRTVGRRLRPRAEVSLLGDAGGSGAILRTDRRLRCAARV